MQIFIIITIIMIIVELKKTNHQVKHPSNQQLELRKRWLEYDKIQSDFKQKVQDAANSLKKN